MNKILLKLSGVSFFMGVLTLLVTSYTSKLVPKLARIKFIGEIGSFAEGWFEIDFIFERRIAYILIILGLVGAVLCIIKKDKDSSSKIGF